MTSPSQLIFKIFTVCLSLGILGIDISPVILLPRKIVVAAPNQQPVLMDAEGIKATGKQGNYNAEILANSPPDKVWKILTDYENFSDVVPDVVSSKIIENKGNQKIIEQVFFASYTFGLKTKVQLKVVESYPKDINMQLMKSDHLNTLEGRLQLTPKGSNQTLISYTLAIDPRFGFIKPAFYKAYEEQLLQNLRFIKKAVESGS